MVFSSLCLCRFIDFWSTSLSNSGFCRAIDRSARWCVCVLDYTYFTWYECPSRNFFHVAIFSLLASENRFNANWSMPHYAKPTPKNLHAKIAVSFANLLQIWRLLITLRRKMYLCIHFYMLILCYEEIEGVIHQYKRRKIFE